MNLLRQLEPNQHARVGFIELFFDLVFVFAVTQLSHTLLHDLTPIGALQVFILFMAVWWAWIDTAWVTNWLDPQKWPVRLMLLALMLAGLVMSTSLPEAFGERGLIFACAYATLQAGRSVFTLLAFRKRSSVGYQNFQRITAWIILDAGLWIAGGFAEGDVRLAFWLAAVGVELAGPMVRFWTPWQGSSSIADWAIEGGHMAERAGLFIIIALGESILVTGATFAEAEWTTPTVLAFIVAFIGSAALWWIYFDTGQERGTESIVRAAEPGRIARSGYSYLHIPIVAGIIVSAVGDEMVLAHPTGHLQPGMAATLVGGPILYLVGTFCYRYAVLRVWSWTFAVGAIALASIAWNAEQLSPLALSSRVTVALVVIAIAEMIVVRLRRRRVGT